jgi:hypothetical protein
VPPIYLSTWKLIMGTHNFGGRLWRQWIVICVCNFHYIVLQLKSRFRQNFDMHLVSQVFFDILCHGAVSTFGSSMHLLRCSLTFAHHWTSQERQLSSMFPQIYVDSTKGTLTRRAIPGFQRCCRVPCVVGSKVCNDFVDFPC